MTKIAKRYQITIVKTATLGDNQTVELSHNESKELWFITFRGDFYTEFTFSFRDIAETMYGASLNSEVFMDFLAEESKKEGGE